MTSWHEYPPSVRSLFEPQLVQLKGWEEAIAYGFLCRCDNADAWGWYWGCMPWPGLLMSRLRLVIRRAFVLREDPQTDYVVVSLLSSSDARLMNEQWVSGTGSDASEPFVGRIHPVLRENVSVFPSRAGLRELPMEAGSVHETVSLCLLPEFVERLRDEDAQVAEGLSRALDRGADLNACDELRAALATIDPRRAGLAGACSYCRARVLDVLAALATISYVGPVPEWRRRGSSSLAAEVDGLLLSSLTHPPSLEEIASQLHLGRTKLCEDYRAETGCTIGRRLRHLRIEQAKALLSQRSANVSEVARLVGYAHQPSFTAAFTRECGMTPTAWCARVEAGRTPRQAGAQDACR